MKHLKYEKRCQDSYTIPKLNVWTSERPISSVSYDRVGQLSGSREGKEKRQEKEASKNRKRENQIYQR